MRRRRVDVKVLKVVPKVLGGCAEGTWRLCRRYLEVVPKVVEVVLMVVVEIVLKVVDVVLKVMEVMPKVMEGMLKVVEVVVESAEGGWRLCRRWKKLFLKVAF